MRYLLEITRRESPDASPRLQTVEIETEDKAYTVAAALSEINSRPTLDTEGREVAPVSWEHSCLQKKCGACAMVINGRPSLACDARLSEVSIKGAVRLEPLRKFPVIADLRVDRSIMMENLKKMRLWLRDSAPSEESIGDVAYEASRCIQCGCCLEICPNFFAGGEFCGAAAMTPFSRILAELPEKECRRDYTAHFYEGCGKSLACRDVCPMGIDTEGLLVKSAAAAVWGRFLRKGRRK